MSGQNRGSETLPTNHDSDAWFFVGLTSSFPDLATTSGPGRKSKLSKLVPCADDGLNDDPTHASPAAKVFQIPPSDSSSLSSPSQPIELTSDEAIDSVGLEDQVLVFRYKRKFHAVDHQCPHRAYPLCRGTLYDIEDFGIVFSAGITCPKHGWAFDLFTGESDRGVYVLGVWRTELRDLRVRDGAGVGVDDEAEEGVREVWVRKR